jgi:stage II sporulation protein AA (anti-sigma F factor antagonist)
MSAVRGRSSFLSSFKAGRHRFERGEREDGWMGNSDRIREDVGLTVRVEQDGDALVVSAYGELNLTNVKALDAELRMAIAGDASAVILDLGAVSFIDSAGLRVVLLMAKHSLRNGGRLRLVRGSVPLERAIVGSGVEHLLPARA